MAPELVGLIGFIILGLLIILGVPISIGLLSVSVAGLFYHVGFNGTSHLFVNNGFTLIANFTFTALPMFLLMGYLAYHSGLVGSAYDTASLWMSRFPGGLAIATCVASGMLGACMGSGSAATAAMSRIAVPEMIRHGYDKSLATGTVAAASTVAVLVPPSIIMVIYATFTGTSLGRMLLAGYFPGVLSVAIYAVMIGIRVKLTPRLAPTIEDITWKDRFVALKDVWGIALLIVILLGGIYSGFFTATEVAALGAAVALILLLISRKMTWSVLKDSFFETLRLNAMVFLLVFGGMMFSLFMAMSGIPKLLALFIISAQLSAFWVVLLALFVHLILGCIMDDLGIMFLTLPILLPILEELNVSLIWFGILLIKTVELGAITPPFGISVYIVKGVIGEMVPLGSIFRGIGWFVLMDLVTISILLAFPQISLWLPAIMKGG
jgi:tripartite ATP-independent transporter DctM subunit